jgi:pimeloyl-ACP methyl ester carboxylesterase
VLTTGPDWPSVIEVQLPGAVAQMERDAATFFDSDLPGLLEWEFSPAQARRITAAALYIGAGDSGPWFAEVRDLIRAWLPHAEHAVVDGADHSLVLTHTPAVAAAVVPFLQRHPMGVGGSREAG